MTSLKQIWVKDGYPNEAIKGFEASGNTYSRADLTNVPNSRDAKATTSSIPEIPQ